MANAGITKIFEDHGVSGTKAARPGLDAALDYLRRDDVLVVWRLDRLGRNTVNVLTLIQDLGHRGIGFRSLTEGLDTGGVYSGVLLALASSLSALERDLLVERTRAGLEAARARGRVGGRPRALDDKGRRQVVSLYRSRTVTIRQIAEVMKVSEATVYRCIRDMNAERR
jgi:DNA invertase Pin-like site-specific DNA recombinase